MNLAPDQECLPEPTSLLGNFSWVLRTRPREKPEALHLSANGLSGPPSPWVSDVGCSSSIAGSSSRSARAGPSSNHARRTREDSTGRGRPQCLGNARMWPRHSPGCPPPNLPRPLPAPPLTLTGPRPSPWAPGLLNADSLGCLAFITPRPLARLSPCAPRLLDASASARPAHRPASAYKRPAYLATPPIGHPRPLYAPPSSLPRPLHAPPPAASPSACPALRDSYRLRPRAPPQLARDPSDWLERRVVARAR